MIQQLENTEDFTILAPDVSNLITENDQPLDNFCSEKHQRLLTSVLYSYKPKKTFLAAANVGIYHNIGMPPIVPDLFLSLEVKTPDNWWEKAHRCYLVWEFGKVPEVVLEIVSNKVGEELGEKLKIYERMRVSYYIIFDPAKHLSDSVLRIFEIRGSKYFETQQTWLEQVSLGLTLWEGEFEGRKDIWLRWCDKKGDILLIGDEKNIQLENRALVAENRALAAEEKAAKLAAKLKELGIEID